MHREWCGLFYNVNQVIKYCSEVKQAKDAKKEEIHVLALGGCLVGNKTMK